MELIKQRHGYDCVVACLAMVTGENYEHIVKNLDDRAKDCLKNKEGLYATSEINLLDKLGFDWDFVELDNGWEPNCKCGVLYVPSKNKLGLNPADGKPYMHAIVYYDGKIYDPSPKKTYESLDEALKSATWVNRIPFYGV